MSIRYPILNGTRKKDHEMLLNTIEDKCQDRIDKGIIPEEKAQSYRDAMAEEVRVFTKVGMDGFMLSMSKIVNWCKSQGFAIGPGRGSVAGSRVAYVTGITDVDPERWGTVFSRFCNEDRVEVGDIDIDVVDEQRPMIFKKIIEMFGERYTGRVPSYGTLQDKAAIKLIVKYLKNVWDQSDAREHDEDNPYTVAYAESVIKAFNRDEDEARGRYPNIFKYFDILCSVKQSQSVHPAGIVISPVTLDDNVGMFNKDGDNCLLLDMDEIHEIGLVKYDFLVLNNVSIINNTCNYIGKPYPKADEFDWNDAAVWDSMSESPVGLFQFESQYAFDMLRKYKPKNIAELSALNAALRPSGATYRDDFIARKPHKNPSKLIDELLRENNGYLIYQEDVIAFLQQICGLSGSEADNVRRAIGRKDEERLNKALPSTLEGYCSKSDKPRDIAEKEAKEFIQILKDASEYMFGKNHSIAYSMITYELAYLRHYYPLEFCCAYLNRASTDEDTVKGTEYAGQKKISVVKPTFGVSKGTYFFDKQTNTIAKGIGSIKSISSAAGDELYKVSQTYDGDSFANLLIKIKQECPSVKKTTLLILIRLDYFERFGNAAKLQRIFDFMFEMNYFIGKKSLTQKLTSDERFMAVAKPYVNIYGKSGKPLRNAEITDPQGLINAVETEIKNADIKDCDIRAKIRLQREYLGYIAATGKPEDRRKLFISNVYPMNLKTTGKPWAYTLIAQSVGTGKISRLTLRAWQYKAAPVNPKDIIYAAEVLKNTRGYWELTNYKQI